MTKNTDKLAGILPDGLTEETIAAIDKLVKTAITEQVEKKVGKLTGKVIGFLNIHMDKIKDSALTQLTEENKEFRRAKMMDSILESVALEVAPDDHDSALGRLVTEQKQSDQSNDVLTSELNEALEQNTRRGIAVQILNKKAKKLEKDLELMTENFTTLQESKKEPFKSSEKGVAQDINGNVTAEGADAPEVLTEGVVKVDNPFITKGLLDRINADKDIK